ncbi:PEP/pyruvate-binding domain-containing protein [Nitratireductor sp. OM-1]|uniref:PEP/pyruvate-binding domain-containing protein n=1 Tax=Nitratireductor sp. OM-1 TaxID=1756988 RepID=UPI0013AF93CC|nr:PEP/pyruvate-binding domain-containing protein [Nitratireductor sp. OM-1]
MDKRIFRFSQNHCDWAGDDADAKKILGGKGAGLVQMCRADMPVPPGFTITTEVCNVFLAIDPEQGSIGTKDEFLDHLMQGVAEHDQWLSTEFGFTPLVSVRSGAPISMPGMMDTILNVGLTDETLPEWEDRIGQRAALDSYRRLIQMLGATAYGVPMPLFDEHLEDIKETAGVSDDKELTVTDLQELIECYKMVFQAVVQHAFPQSRTEQLRAAVRAVFDSWMNERAIEYRKLNQIDGAMGTAVNIQAMVFGNMGDDSGSGVAFTRDPSTGENHTMGEYLHNAQGEDVVAGIRTPYSLDELFETKSPPWATEFCTLCSDLEDMYDDMVDLEFTVQQGKLWLLQSRVGKRSARAAFKIAADLVEEGVIDRGVARSRLTAQQFKTVRRPTIDPSFDVPPALVGLPACPGVVTGVPVLSSKDAINCNEPCILITNETTPDDIGGMNAAVGVLTKTGGATSHAAVVARAMDKACVVGCTGLDILGDWTDVTKVTIDGATGRVWFNVDVPVIDSSDAKEVATVMGWCMEVLGCCEAAVVDLGADKPHTIMAAHWWGNEDVLNAVLDGIAELPSRQHVTLDTRSPNDLAPFCDYMLADCFGETAPDHEFKEVIISVLKQRSKELKGLSLAPWEDMPELYSEGFTPAGAGSQHVPLAVPADYAAFSVLGR